MSGAAAKALAAHLATGQTTFCRAWGIERKDGVRFGFTDHDGPLAFEGFSFLPDTGLSALAISQSTGLAVDNTEALGALSDAGIREDEIEQGRFDGAEVTAWLVNWAIPEERKVQFRGSIGELHRSDNLFRAELRGLTEALNRPLGKVYQKPCAAVLGDRCCRVDLKKPEHFIDISVSRVAEAQQFTWANLGEFPPGWFARGRLDVLEGSATGLWSMIRHDRAAGDRRSIELWEPIRGEVPAGTLVRLTAGCDKRAETCRVKFDNLLNFQGFPDLPGADWVIAVPRSTGVNSGGSLR